LPWQRRLTNGKKNGRSVIQDEISIIIGKKITKNGPVDPVIIGVQEIIENKKEINANRTYSPVGKHAERAK